MKKVTIAILISFFSLMIVLNSFNISTYAQNANKKKNINDNVETLMIDHNYLFALNTLDNFLHAWVTRDFIEGPKYITEGLKNSEKGNLKSFFCGISNPHHQAYEVIGSNYINSDTIRFKVWLYEHVTGQTFEPVRHPQPYYIDVVKINTELWLVNTMPTFFKNTSTDISIDRNAKTNKSQNNSKTSVCDEGNTIKIEYEYINNLKAMEVINLNNSSNTKSVLALPTNWHANKAIYKTADSFEFKEQKNKEIKKLYSYEIFDDKNSNRGYFEFNGGGFPNHCVVEKIIYNGATKLGNGLIYLLECDLPKEKVTEKYSTYNQIFSIIPIQNEILVYSVSISVPLGENKDMYVEIMKKMLIEKSK